MKKSKSNDLELKYMLSLLDYLAPLQIKFCNHFLKLHPKFKFDQVYLDRGKAYHDTKKYSLAIKDYSRALLIKPDAFIYEMRAAVYITLCQYKKAVKDLNKAIQLRQKAGKRNLGVLLSKRADCYVELKNYNLAIKDLKKAIRSSERKGSYYARIAELYSSSKEKEIRNGKKAVNYANKAINSSNEFRKRHRLPKIDSPYLLNVLAAALAQSGKFNEAIKIQQEAITLVKDEKEIAKYKHRLRLFQQRTPFIEK